MRLLLAFVLPCFVITAHCQESSSFSWPEGYEMALSLTFDDARSSQPNGGVDLLDAYGAKATFYVLPESVEPHLEKWQHIVDTGHEIGNHSINHPCTGNFSWSKDHALEAYTLEQMEAELIEASRQIKSLLNVTPRSYAYPCGETTIGRGNPCAERNPTHRQAFPDGQRLA